MTHADVPFRWMTDQDIENRLAKRPLEVGANLIARRAWAALAFRSAHEADAIVCVIAGASS